MIRSVLLLFLAFLCLENLFYVLFAVQIIRYLYLGKDLEPFLFGLAKAIDYVFAFIIFGVWGHTLSALVYKKNITWAIKFINWMFQDGTHCMVQYEDEFLKA